MQGCWIINNEKKNKDFLCSCFIHTCNLKMFRLKIHLIKKITCASNFCVFLFPLLQKKKKKSQFYRWLLLYLSHKTHPFVMHQFVYVKFKNETYCVLFVWLKMKNKNTKIYYSHWQKKGQNNIGRRFVKAILKKMNININKWMLFLFCAQATIKMKTWPSQTIIRQLYVYISFSLQAITSN